MPLARWAAVETLAIPTRPLRAWRARARSAASAGFTLIELMVVVVLISILAVIAVPALRVARDDRMAFDYARRIQQLSQRARVRAAARGAAHLLLAGPSGTGPSGTRGRVTVWEALDNTTAASGGPNPVSSCKGAAQWAVPGAYGGGIPAASLVVNYVDGVELATTGVNVDADITAQFFFSATAGVAIPTTAVGALAICYTPGGSVFAGSDTTSTANAIQAMQNASLFTGVADIAINRHDSASNIVGLTRNVLIPGSAAARILSQ